MPTKKKPVRLSKASSSGARKPARRTKLGREIVAGLKEALAYSRGEISLPVRLVNVPPPVDIKKIRAKSGLSQSEFAARYGFSHRTLQEWEQDRVKPDRATRAYLAVIDHNPQAVEAALSGRSPKVMRAG
jgi:putative transcriptional regulator